MPTAQAMEVPALGLGSHLINLPVAGREIWPQLLLRFYLPCSLFPKGPLVWKVWRVSFFLLLTVPLRKRRPSRGQALAQGDTARVVLPPSPPDSEACWEGAYLRLR